MGASVSDCEQQLRDVVNHPDIQRELIKSPRNWQQLCASMDVIGDTAAAIAAHQQLPDVDDTGYLYLITYGILQVLVVQQDAVRHVAEAVGFPYSFSPELLRIRTIRNSAIGHPSKHKRTGGGITESSGIIQVSLNQKGFTLYSFDWDDGTPSQDINLPELIGKQICQVCTDITSIMRYLETPLGGSRTRVG